MIIVPTYDSSTNNAPQSFFDSVQTAINILDSRVGLPFNVTINIRVGYGTFDGTTLPNQTISEGGLDGNEQNISYASLRNHLIVASDIDWSSASLPAGSSLNGVSTFTIGNAEAKIFGIAPTYSAQNPYDGEIGIGTGFAANQIIPAVLHEVGHALGRLNHNNSEFDIFRFSGAGQRLFTTGSTSAPAYFSMDNGQTDLADWGQTSDPSDFLNPTGQGPQSETASSNLTPNDPFNENVGTMQTLTSRDVEMTDALGFSASYAWTGSGASVHVGDMDGGPIAGDLLQLEPNGNADVLVTNGSSFSWARNWGNGFTPGDRTADFNGDNKTDVIQFFNGQAFVTTSNGTSFNPFSVWTSGVTGAEKFGDVDGNGRTDLLQYYNGTIEVAFSQGNKFGNWSVAVTGANGTERVADFSGDGKSDLLQFFNGTVYVAKSNGNAFNPFSVWTSGATGNEKFADVDGNGRQDLLQYYNGGLEVAFSLGNRFGAWTSAVNGANGLEQTGHFAGTSRDDLIQFFNGTAYVATSNGNGYNAFKVWTTGCTGNELIADVNGDGKADLVQLYQNGGAYVALSSGTSFGGWQLWGNSPGDTSNLTVGSFGSSGSVSSPGGAVDGSSNKGSSGSIDLFKSYIASSLVGSGIDGSTLDLNSQGLNQPVLLASAHS